MRLSRGLASAHVFGDSNFENEKRLFYIVTFERTEYSAILLSNVLKID